MTFITSDTRAVATAGNPFSARLAAWRSAYETYRAKRAIYLRTLRELRSYRPWEMHDLKIDPADFETVARKQAGW